MCLVPGFIRSLKAKLGSSKFTKKPSTVSKALTRLGPSQVILSKSNKLYRGTATTALGVYIILLSLIVASNKCFGGRYDKPQREHLCNRGSSLVVPFHEQLVYDLKQEGFNYYLLYELQFCLGTLVKQAQVLSLTYILSYSFCFNTFYLFL